MVHTWTVGRCIMCTGMRLLLLIRPFIFLFISLQFSSIKHFRRCFLGTYEAQKVETSYKQEQWMDVLCIPKSVCCCLFILLVLHFSFKFSNIKTFCRTFLRNYESIKVESKKISNDQESTQTDPTSCPQTQKGNN